MLKLMSGLLGGPADQQVPAQAEIERQLTGDAKIVLQEQAEESEERLRIGVDEVTADAIGKTEQEARARMTSFGAPGLLE